MAKRKLKKSVKIILGSLVMATSIVTVVNINKSDKVENFADSKADELNVNEETTVTYMEMLEENEVMAQEWSYGTESIYVRNDGNYGIFLTKDTKDTIYVKNSDLRKWYAYDMDIGDNAMVTIDANLEVKFVAIIGGKEIEYKQVVLDEITSDNSMARYMDEETKESFVVGKEFMMENNLLNANVGSLATCFYFDGELIAMTKGY